MRHLSTFRLLVLVLIVLFWAGNAESYAQPRITPRLQERLTSTEQGDFLRVIAVFQDQVDIRWLDQQLRISHASLAERHRIIVEALQERANHSQPELFTFLEDLKREGKIRSLSRILDYQCHCPGSGTGSHQTVGQVSSNGLPGH